MPINKHSWADMGNICPSMAMVSFFEPLLNIFTSSNKAVLSPNKMGVAGILGVAAVFALGIVMRASFTKVICDSKALGISRLKACDKPDRRILWVASVACSAVL